MESPIEIPHNRDTSQKSFLVGAHDYLENRMALDDIFAMGVKDLKGRGRSKKKDLKKVLIENKKNLLVRNFIQKIKLNATWRRPVEFENYEESEQEEGLKHRLRACVKGIGAMEGLQFSDFILVLWSFVNIIQITIMVFVFSVMMAFPETTDYGIFLKLRVFSIALYVLDMLLNFTTQRYEKGRLLGTIEEIARFYIHNGFIIDLISILIFPIDLVVDSSIANVISFVAIIKLVNNIGKFEKFEYLAINNSEKQQYYGLVKVFLTNFVIGHFLSVFLNLMARIDASQNWQVKLGIQNAQWYIKYVWGYYWGTNIMLTVGFGDLAATNHYEAIILVFIQTFSCITLAYNISYVGALIGSIRQKEEVKKKKLKTFHQMCQENQIPSELESKVCNFIEEEYRIKEQFEYDDHDRVLESLPKSIQKEYRIEANKILFDGLGFLNNLSKKSLLNLAEQVTRKICHPEEIVFKRGSVVDFIILQKGTIDFTCKINSQLDGKVIESFEVIESMKPKILTLDFIKNKTLNYNIKSQTYSVLYFLNREKFMESIRPSEMDYQLFCLLRDRSEHIIEQNKLYHCFFCKSEYHDRFECSRLHYIPLKQTQILKHLHRINKAKQPRKFLKRRKLSTFPLYETTSLKEEQKRFIEDNFDAEHYKEIENLFNFYKANQDRGKLKSNSSDVYLAPVQPANRKSTVHKTNFIDLSDEREIHRFREFMSVHAQFNPQHQDFWEIEIDQAYNYRYYNSGSNPDKLSTLNIKRAARVTKFNADPYAKLIPKL